MKSRLEDIPIYKTEKKSVGSEHFNLVKIALKRLENPLRIELPRLRTLDLILDDETWIVVDRELNDVPVMAWLDFETKNRSLHEPVACRLNHYHAHSEIIYDKVFEAMTILIGEQLGDGLDHDNIVPINKR